MAEESTTTTENLVKVYVNGFNEESAKSFHEQFLLAADKKQPIIPVYIDSYGGSVHSALFMNDIIRASEVNVATIAIGKAMSAGLFLLAAGTPGFRYCAPNCALMIHSTSAGIWGKLLDMEIALEESKRLMKVFFQVMAKNCNQKSSYFLELIKSKMDKNFYMTPREGLKHQIIDKIGIPSFQEVKQTPKLAVIL